MISYFFMQPYWNIVAFIMRSMNIYYFIMDFYHIEFSMNIYPLFISIVMNFYAVMRRNAVKRCIATGSFEVLLFENL